MDLITPSPVTHTRKHTHMHTIVRSPIIYAYPLARLLTVITTNRRVATPLPAKILLPCQHGSASHFREVHASTAQLVRVQCARHCKLGVGRQQNLRLRWVEGVRPDISPGEHGDLENYAYRNQFNATGGGVILPKRALWQRTTARRTIQSPHDVIKAPTHLSPFARTSGSHRDSSMCSKTRPTELYALACTPLRRCPRPCPRCHHDKPLLHKLEAGPAPA